MEKEFIPYEQALALKELGFDEPCLAQYKKYDVGEATLNIGATLDIGFSKNEIIMQFHKLSKFCSAPTFSQAFRWFREKYNLESHIKKDWTNGICNGDEAIIEDEDGLIGVGTFNTYEEAELECLKKLIEIVKDGENR